MRTSVSQEIPGHQLVQLSQGITHVSLHPKGSGITHVNSSEKDCIQNGVHMLLLRLPVQPLLTAVLRKEHTSRGLRPLSTSVLNHQKNDLESSGGSPSPYVDTTTKMAFSSPNMCFPALRALLYSLIRTRSTCWFAQAPFRASQSCPAIFMDLFALVAVPYRTRHICCSPIERSTLSSASEASVTEP